VKRLATIPGSAPSVVEEPPLDVLMVCGELGSGGTQRVVANIAAGLSGQGHRVVVASFCDGAPDFFAMPSAVPRERMCDDAPPSAVLVAPFARAFRRVQRVLRRRLTSVVLVLPARAQGVLRTRSMARLVTAQARRLPRVRWIRDIITSLEPATVVSFGPGPNVVALLAAQGLSCRVVISERNDLGVRSLDLPLASLCRWLYPDADAVTANAHSTLAALGADVSPDRLVYVPNLLSIPAGARTGPPPPGFVGPCVLIVARLVREKEHRVLLDAFASLPPDLHHWRLAVVGSGEREASLRRRADRLGIGDRVDWHGRTDDPYAFYRHAEIFALPSRFEGMPNALLEAMSFGLPPIVADGTPGPLEVVRHAQTGLVTRTGDPESLASAITLLATRADLRRTLGEAARREASRFETAAALAAWTDVLDLPRRAGERDEVLR
jgi:glycosyltransferase involved in cell wall biosynthesis